VGQFLKNFGKMKKRILFFLCLFYLSVAVRAQPGFRSVYFEEYAAILLDVVVDSDSTFVLYGMSRDTFAGPQGIKFVRLDTFGNILSEKNYIDSSVILTTKLERQDLIQTQDGGFAMMGGTLTATPVPYLLKVHGDLSFDFIKKYPLYGVYASNSGLLELSTGGYMLVGEQTIGDNDDIFVIRTDAKGNQLWRKSYGGDDLQESVLGIRELNSNRFVLNGNHYHSSADVKSLLLEIDSLGNQLDEWESDKEYAIIFDYTILSDSSWICSSGTWEYNAQYGAYMSRPLVFRMDKHRNVMWTKKLGVLMKYRHFTNMLPTHDGNYLATGEFLVQGTIKAAHYKFKANGDSLWMRLDSAYVDNGGAYFPKTKVISSAMLPSGSVISVGYAERASPYGLMQVGFVMKISPDGCVDTLNCWPVANSQDIAQVKKVAVYPNPVGDYLTVNLPDYPHKAHIYFYDMTGRFLRKERVRHGANELGVNDFPKGMIFYEVRSQGRVLGRGKVVRD